MRTLVDISDSQLKELAKLSAAQKRSRAAVIRDAIAAYVEKQKKEEKLDGFGLWGDRKIDGVEYQRKLRSEW